METAAESLLRLHLGCGDCAPSGWVNVDTALGARLYRILGDRDVELSDRGSYPVEIGDPLPPADARARWSYEVDEWIYRVGLGIRFQWLGNPGPDLDE